MKRIALMVIKNILLFPYYWWKTHYFAKHPDKYTDEEKYGFINWAVKRANKGGRVTIKAFGLSNIPEKNGFLMTPNHQGLYDCLALMECFPRPFSVVVKKEAMNYIFVKDVLGSIGAIGMDRDDVRQSLQVIRQVSGEISKGRNFLIFPEGTRNKDLNNVHEFKGGSFKCAYKAKSPILPVALIDAFKGFDSGTIEPITVEVHILPAICYEEYKDMKTPELAELVRDRIQSKIDEVLSARGE